MIKKPSVLRIILFLLTKYIVYYVILALIGNRFKIIVLDNAKNSSEIVDFTFSYIIEVLWGIFLQILILILPLFLLFKLNKLSSLFFGLLIIIIAEYFIYEGSISNTGFDMCGVLDGIIGLIFFLIFFRKYLLALREKNLKTN